MWVGLGVAAVVVIVLGETVAMFWGVGYAIYTKVVK